MSCGGGSTPFDDSQKFARFSRIISKGRYTLNKKFSWAEETGDFTWHCESCHACFELYPLSDEAKAVYNVKEIAIHKGKQESSIGQPHYCEDCGVAPTIDTPGESLGVCSYALDEDQADRLWALSEEWSGEKFAV